MQQKYRTWPQDLQQLADSDEVTRDWGQLRSKDLINLYSSPFIMMIQ